MRFVAAFVIGVFALQARPESVRAGVLLDSADGPVAAIEGAAISPGAAVTVVTFDSPQQVWRATIGRSLPSVPVMAQRAMDGPYYAVSPEPGSSLLPKLAVIVLGRADTSRSGDAVVLRLGDPAREIRVRSCASMEGLHLTLWAGEPLRSPRLWHAYYYAGYDLQPTCTAADVGL